MSMARAERWEEEVLLTQEEMRRILVFLDKKRDWWDLLTLQPGVAIPGVESGLVAYAHKQAALVEAQANDFAALWLEIFKDYGIPTPQTWPERYRFATHQPDKQVRSRRDRTRLRKKAIIEGLIVKERL